MATAGLHTATAAITLRPTVSFATVETQIGKMTGQEREHYIKKLKDHLMKVTK